MSLPGDGNWGGLTFSTNQNAPKPSSLGGSDRDSLSPEIAKLPTDLTFSIGPMTSSFNSPVKISHPDDISLVHPVPVTKAEREHFNSIESLTVPQLDDQCLKLLESFEDRELAQTKLNQLNKIRYEKKEAHVKLYKEILSLS